MRVKYIVEIHRTTYQIRKVSAKHIRLYRRLGRHTRPLREDAQDDGKKPHQHREQNNGEQALDDACSRGREGDRQADTHARVWRMSQQTVGALIVGSYDGWSCVKGEVSFSQEKSMKCTRGPPAPLAEVAQFARGGVPSQGATYWGSSCASAIAGSNK